MLNYDEFLTETTLNRKYSAIRAMQKYMNQPGMVNLGGGLPNPECFPIEDITMTLKDGTVLKVSPKDLNTGLQYGQTKGTPELQEFLINLQKRVHSPPGEFDLMLGCGSQDLMIKTYEMFCSPSDAILVECPTYVGVLAWLKPYGVKMIPVDIDSEGLSLDLGSLLDNWDQSKSPKPKVIYTVSSGGNPTGITTTTKRKQEIYKICQKHNIIILEDDPYFYLQYDYSNLQKSYFSMDVDGRVLRFDSLSKVVSAGKLNVNIPGARLGFASGPKYLIEKLMMHQMSTTLTPSGISQMVILEVLRNWGLDGFLAHAEKSAKVYETRCKFFVSILEKYLTGKARWHVPTAGMFCWIELLGCEDSFALISEKAVQNGLLMVPGKEFYPQSSDYKSNFVRASFSFSSHEDMELGVKRLAELL